jgi:putative heme-binding domain-containing protein
MKRINFQPIQKTFRPIALAASMSIIFFSCSQEPLSDASIEIPKGFIAERIFSTDSESFGSWVSIAKDNKNRILVSDQYGKIYRFSLPKRGELLEAADLEMISDDLGFSQGMLWTENGLFVTVNQEDKEAKYPSGIYKLTDSSGDDVYDKIELLYSLNGAGEHGPHSLVQGPDNMIYFIAGNGTKPPDQINYAMRPIWENDNILPIITDPHGIFNGWTPPAGWIARMNPDGSGLEMIATGFRNAYDLAFNEQGELFTFDSDMEWDLGTPWYRPVRLCHVIKGAEFGWRTGSGKWPSYYTDNLDGILDIGQGSPTGVLTAQGLNFPAPYHQGLFIMDWSFGTMYHVTLTEKGSSYSAEATEFISGAPLPLTDMVEVNGEMIFTTGGRRLESGLYRIYSNNGSDSDRDMDVKVNDEVLKRRFLEKTKNIDTLWAYLGNQDRYLKFAARTSLESLDDTSWVGRIANENNFDRKIQGLISVSRLRIPVDSTLLIYWYSSIETSELKDYQRLDYLRAVQLLFLRMGNKAKQQLNWVEELRKIETSGDFRIAREKLKLLAFLNDPGVISDGLILLDSAINDPNNELISESVTQRSDQYGEVLDLIRKKSPQTNRISILETLSVVEDGWTDSLSAMYFSAFNSVFLSGGGNSYKGFVIEILERALTRYNEEEKERYREISGVNFTGADMASLSELPVPVGPGRNYSKEDIPFLVKDLKDADVVNGKKMYQASLCGQCHVKGNEGKPIGPGLNTLAGRFSPEDVLKSIIDPSEVISDQYAMRELTLTNGQSFSAKVVSVNADTMTVALNPFDPSNTRKIPVLEIVENNPSSRSMMPSALINRLNEEEVKDLLGYLLIQE